jgi:enterochelin esterase-like enzyme
MDGIGCDAEEMRFRFVDPDRSLARVRLQQRMGLQPTEFSFDPGERAWTLVIPRPPAWRVEYQFELEYPDGSTETVNDPENPKRVDGAFGDKSVLECPDYAPPAWLSAPTADGSWQDLAVAAPSLGRDVDVRIWSPDRPTDLVLVAHDGPEFDRLGALSRFCSASIAAGHLPAHHLVLLEPALGLRNEWYSANSLYAEALIGTVLPKVSGELHGSGTARPVVGLGASLGALSMLHAQRQDPSAFAGLFLQSGSFFLPRTDQQERGFAHYQRIIRFVGTVLREPATPVPAGMTCGLVEENLFNNRRMASALRAQGYLGLRAHGPAPLAEVPDGHNFTAWRDSFHPHLTELLQFVWSADA